MCMVKAIADNAPQFQPLREEADRAFNPYRQIHIDRAKEAGLQAQADKDMAQMKQIQTQSSQTGLQVPGY